MAFQKGAFLFPPAPENRNAWLDLCRIFAIFAVVLTHSVEKFYPLYPLDVHASFSPAQRIIALLLFTIGRLGVPVFLFLSGYLLPGRYAATSTEAYVKFLKKKWIPLFLCVELWYAIYVILMSAFGKCIFSFRFLLSCMTFSSRPPLTHVWYMEMILGLYLVFPLLGLLKTVFGKQGIFVLFAGSVFCHLVRPLFQICWIDLSFLGDCYLSYVLFGYCVFLSKNRLEKIFAHKSVYALLLFLFIANLGFCVFRQNQTTPFRLMWYDNLSIIPVAMFPPLLLLPLGKWHNSLLKYISIHAFAVYLMHNVVLTLFRSALSAISARSLRVFSACLISITTPLLITFALYKCPRVKQWLFLVKSAS